MPFERVTTVFVERVNGVEIKTDDQILSEAKLLMPFIDVFVIRSKTIHIGDGLPFIEVDCLKEISASSMVDGIDVPHFS